MENEKYLLFFSRLCRFESEEVEQRYATWKEPSRYAQIAAASLLTSFLYVLYAQLDRWIAPAEVASSMITLHLYILAPMLLFISLLSFWQVSYKLVIFLLIIAPVFAAMGNLIIVSDAKEFITYLTEDYLIIFWIFTVSGLKLLHATISALITFMVVFIATYFFFEFPLELFVMHCFWMVATFSFGFLAAYLIEASSRTIFFNKEALEKSAVTDSLTGLYNRTKLDDVLQSELNRSQRYKQSFGLLILDIDYFKEVNDSFGHAVGDTILVEMSHLMKNHIRLSDILIRWGGEEFVIICLGTTPDDLIKLADNLRLEIGKHQFDRVGLKTVSIGATIYEDGDTVNSILKRADTALYSVKKSGRNSVAFL